MRSPPDLRERAGTRGDPNRDQHFLDDERVIERMLTYAREAEMDLANVLEIGAGAGALTAYLLAHAEHVTAIERDRQLAGFLTEEFTEEIENQQLTVMQADALTAELPSFSACISNLPYGVSSELIFLVLPSGRPLLAMVQREFAERMAAEAGTSEYGRLSVTSQHYGDVDICEIVPSSAFTPPPPVESALVRVTPRTPTYELRNEERFFDVVRALFTQRRKTLRNAIRNTVHISHIEDPGLVLDALPEELLARRPDTVSPDEFAHIANVSIEVEDD